MTADASALMPKRTSMHGLVPITTTSAATSTYTSRAQCVQAGPFRTSSAGPSALRPGRVAMAGQAPGPKADATPQLVPVSVTSPIQASARLRDAGVDANTPQPPRERRGPYFRDAPDVTTAHPKGR